MCRSTVAISAPGKVLLAGGYLVLDRDHTGLVFGLDARLHVHVQQLPTSPSVELSEIIVRSPQFNDAEWRYGYRATEDQGGIEVVQLKGWVRSSSYWRTSVMPSSLVDLSLCSVSGPDMCFRHNESLSL